MLLHISIFQGFQDHFQYELKKDRRAALRIGGLQRHIIVCLVGQNHGFNRQIGKERFLFLENQCLPETTGSSVTICKSMDKFKLIVGYARSDEGMGLCSSQSQKELLHGFRNILRRCFGVNRLSPEYTPTP